MITSLGIMGSIALYTAAASAAIGAASAAMSGIQQSKNAKFQGKMAQYQADVAQQNRKLQEQQDSAIRRQGQLEAEATRRKAAALVGQQRNITGMSGAATDIGSPLDVNLATVQNAEFDAINQYNQRVDEGYAHVIQGWNYGTQAAGYEAQSSAYNQQANYALAAGGLNTAGALVGGISDVASTWNKFRTPSDTGAGRNINSYYRDRNASGAYIGG